MRTLAVAAAALLTLTMFVSVLEASTVGSCPSTPPGSADTFIQPGKTVLRSTISPVGTCIIKAGSSCGIGFLLSLPEAGEYYATTAGHCMPEVISNRITYAMHPVYGAWGELVYSKPSGEDIAPPLYDIALIKILPDFHASIDPAVPVFGGPTMTTADTGPLVGLSGEDYSPTNPATSREDLSLVGHFGLPGAVVGYPAGLPRVGPLLSTNATNYFCLCATGGGDSGSPHIDLRTGAALGLHHSATPNVDRQDPDNPVFVPSYDPNWPRATTGANFSEELRRLQDLTADGRGRAVDWEGLTLMTAPLTDYARQLFAEEI